VDQDALMEGGELFPSLSGNVASGGAGGLWGGLEKGLRAF
jgi:hypothetical protein